MKYGDTLPQRSIREWLPYNIDYTEIKQLIKLHTTQQPPVETPDQSPDYEEELFEVFVDQFDRIGLFVKSKTGEFDRRLDNCERQIAELQQRSQSARGSTRVSNRYARLEQAVEQIARDIQSLEQFVDVQRTGFRKLLKKYRKWTGSSRLPERFNIILNSPTAFHRIANTDQLAAKASELSKCVNDGINLHGDPDSITSSWPELSALDKATAQNGKTLDNRRSSSRMIISNTSSKTSSTATEGSAVQSYFSTPMTSDGGEMSSASKKKKRIKREFVPISNSRYWNEFDDEEDVDEPYTVLLRPSTASSHDEFNDQSLSDFLLAPFSKAVTKFRNAHGKNTGKPHEHSSLLGHGSSDSDDSDSDAGPDYATFTSIANRRIAYTAGHIMFLAVSFLMLGITAVLAIFGESLSLHKQRRHQHLSRHTVIDLSVFVGLLVSIISGIIGFTIYLVGPPRASYLHRIIVWTVFIVVCVSCGAILTMVSRDITDKV